MSNRTESLNTQRAAGPVGLPARAVGNRTYGGAARRLGLIAVLLALLVALAAAPVLGQDAREPQAPVALVPAQGLVEDLIVEAGETFEGDAVVFSGDARIGGRVDGNLVVRAGDVEIESGAHVTGDVTVWSGDVEVSGRVGGNVITMAGDINLNSGGNVGGDVSTFAGEIDREDGAHVGGNIVRGPKVTMPETFKDIPGLPALPGFQAQPAAPAAPAAPDSAAGRDGDGNPTVVRVDRQTRSLGERILGVFGRLIAATFLTLLVTALAAIVYNVRPLPVDRAADRLRAHTARSFLLGLAVNVTLSVLMGIFFALFCTAPVGAVLGLTLVALNLAGWTVLALALGRRLTKPATLSQSKFSVNVALGALVLTGVPTYLWALGSFAGVTFTFLQIVLLILAAPGVGALLWPVFERVSKGGRLNFGRRSGTAAPNGAAGQTVQGSVVSPVSAAAAPSAGMTSAASYTTEGNPPAPGPAAAPSPVVDVPVAPSSPGESAALDAAAAVSAAAAMDEARRDATEGMAVDETLLDTPTQEVPAVAQDDVLRGDAAPASELDEPPPADDFTRISGIGRTWDQRLKAAGIRTFAQLGAQTPESLAAVLGISVEQVILDDLIGQAQRQ